MMLLSNVTSNTLTVKNLSALELAATLLKRCSSSPIYHLIHRTLVQANIKKSLVPLAHKGAEQPSMVAILRWRSQRKLQTKNIQDLAPTKTIVQWAIRVHTTLQWSSKLYLVEQGTNNVDFLGALKLQEWTLVAASLEVEMENLALGNTRLLEAHQASSISARTSIQFWRDLSVLMKNRGPKLGHDSKRRAQAHTGHLLTSVT